MSKLIKSTVEAHDDGLRLEVWLAQHFEGLSRHKAIEAIREGLVFVDGRKAKKGVRVVAGQTIELAPETRTRTVSESPKALFSNTELIIVNKPAGMPCHPLRLGETGTLLQWIGEQFPEVLKAGEKAREGGLLHRLDTDTSGCVAFARTKVAFEKWAPKFLEGGIGKIYLAIVSDCGPHSGPNGGSKRCTCCGGYPGDKKDHDQLPQIGKSVVVKIPLGRHPSDAGRMVALIDGEERHKGPAMSAKTTIRTLAKGKDCALVEAIIERGRMHQIRVHLAAIGHPIVGDKTYGGTDCGTNRGTNGGIERQALHAWKLVLDKKTEVVAPMPKDMAILCKAKDLVC
jgi:23S rRNA pseudouridine1911/1915/1917 synthase